jgi:hypothetical protein
MMKKINRGWIVAVLLSLNLFAAGKLFYRAFFKYLEPSVPGINFQITELDRLVSTSTLFSCFLAMLPFSMMLMWKFAPVHLVSRRITSVITVFVCIGIAAFMRHQPVKLYFMSVVKPYFIKKGQLNVDYPIDPVRFVYYMLCGFCIGYLISWLCFRNKLIPANQYIKNT